MNLEQLNASLTAFVREAGEDPEAPSPRAAWDAVVRLASTPPMIDDAGDDFIRFEAVVLDGRRIAISITRELTEAEGYGRGSVGYSFEFVAPDLDGTSETLIESATEPDYLPLSQFITDVQGTAAFGLLVGARQASRSSRVSVVDQG